MDDSSTVWVLLNSSCQVSLVTKELANTMNCDCSRKSNLEVVGISYGISYPDFIRMVCIDTRSGDIVTFPAHNVKHLNINVCPLDW